MSKFLGNNVSENSIIGKIISIDVYVTTYIIFLKRNIALLKSYLKRIMNL